jgi:hypothetical protein
MARKTVPTEKRLILSLAAHNGSATLSEIRLNFYGRLASADLNAALEKLTGLVAVERSRSKGNRRPTTRLSLTLHGWAAVQFLRPGWQPQRLATDILKAWLSELQAERDPWAIQILTDAEDARQWRQHEDERKARDRAKEKKRAAREKPEPLHPSAGRNRSPEELEARAAWFAEKTGRAVPEEEQTTVLPPQDVAPTPTIPRPINIPAHISSIAGGFCPRCHGSLPQHWGGCPLAGRADFAPEQAPMPTIGIRSATPADPTDPLIERIKRAGYTTRGNQVLYAGERYVTAEEWVRLNPHVSL